MYSLTQFASSEKNFTVCNKPSNFMICEIYPELKEKNSSGMQQQRKMHRLRPQRRDA